MFIPRIWFDEVERIGKQRCTPFGYVLQGIGDLVGFLGLIALLGVPVYLGYTAIVGTFTWSLLWLLLVPIAVGVVGRVMVELSWWMAFRKNFHYDYERRESTWIEAGEKRSYTYADWQATDGRRIG
jgi:hypothetical protein